MEEKYRLVIGNRFEIETELNISISEWKLKKLKQCKNNFEFYALFKRKKNKKKEETVMEIVKNQKEIHGGGRTHDV